MKRALGFLLCVAPQFLLVAGMTAREEVALRQGIEVRLEVRAFDPMTLFSGRYISVPLAIARLDAGKTRIEPGIAPGDEVCVPLLRGKPFWTALGVQREPPRADGAVFLRGTWKGPNQVDYGIDSFYIPQDGADPSHLSLSLLVRVARNGRASIEDLLVGDLPYAQWNAAQKAR